MKLLLLNYEFPPLGGGASPASLELATHLVEEGNCEIDVVTMGFAGLPLYQDLGPCLRIHRVSCWRSRKELCHPWEQASYLWAGYHKAALLHRSRRFDFCHAHFLIPTGLIAAKLKSRFGLDYLVTSHGSDVPGFNDDRFKFLHRFTGPMLRRVGNQARYVVSPSRFLADLILRNIDAGFADRLKVIPNGIDPRQFAPGVKRRVILASGRLLPRKGFHLLLEAVAERDIGYTVHICGDGPMMRRLLELQKISKTPVILHGWLDNRSAEYRSLLASAAIFVLPSLKENASIALLEAMSAGAAVVTTKVSGCPETVGSAGILVEPGSVSDLQAKLERLVSDDKLLEATQVAMRRRALENFSWSAARAAYHSLFNGVSRQ